MDVHGMIPDFLAMHCNLLSQSWYKCNSFNIRVLSFCLTRPKTVMSLCVSFQTLAGECSEADENPICDE